MFTLISSELFRCAITAKELDWSDGQIRDFVTNRKTTNPLLCVAVGWLCSGAREREPVAPLRVSAR